MQDKGRRIAGGRRPVGRWSRFRAAGKRWWSTPSVTKASWATGLTLLLCVFMISARPLWNQVQPAGRDISWAQVLTTKPAAPPSNAAPPTAAQAAPSQAAPADPLASPAVASSMPPPAPVASVPPPSGHLPVAQAKSEAELFGDQLQALSSLYETVITVLAVGLGLLATAAFAAIRFASMREAESLAREVLRGEEYRAHVADLIKEQVESQLMQVKFDLRELEDRVYALTEQDESVSRAPLPAESVPLSDAPIPEPPFPPAPEPPIGVAAEKATAQPEAGAAIDLPEPPTPPPNAGGIEPSTQENGPTVGKTPGKEV